MMTMMMMTCDLISQGRGCMPNNDDDDDDDDWLDQMGQRVYDK